MIGTVARQLAMAFIGVIGVITITFLLLRMSGDPTMQLLPADAPAEQRDLLRQQMGLDRPLFIQYLDYLWSIVRGDFGASYFESDTVFEMVSRHFLNTLALAASAFTLMLIVALPVGLYSAVRRGGLVDRVVQVICTISAAMPTFWVGLLLIQLFAVQFRWLPSFGTGTVAHMVLPTVTLAFAMLPNIVRLTRSTMLEVLGSAYVKTARAKGLPEFRVLSRTVFRNGIAPVIPLLGIEIGTLLGGAVVTETVFGWPGIGWLAVRAIGRRDFPVIEGIVVYVAIMFVVVTLLVEVTTRLVNPRLRSNQ